MDFVYEQHWCGVLGEYSAGFCGIYHLSYLLNPGTDGAEREKISLASVCNDLGKRRLSHTGRPPQYKGTEIAALYHVPEYAALADQMFLAYIIVQTMRTQAFGKGREKSCHYLISFLYERRRLCWIRSNASK